MIDSQVIRIKNQIKAELDNYDDEINKLISSAYPTETCLNLLKELRGRICDYRNHINNIIRDYDPDNPVETKQKLIVKIHNPIVLEEIKFLDWIRTAQTDQVPWSFVPCIEDLAEKIVLDRKIVVHSENVFNYGMRWSLKKGLAPHPYYILTLPRPHRINILWHCLIGHELFHTRCHEFINKHNAEILSIIAKEVSLQFEKEKVSESKKEPDLFTESDKQTQIADLTKVIHYAWRRAMEELLSDMACVELFGPAGILAMKSFLLCSPENNIPGPENRFYPSREYRIEISWRQLDMDGIHFLLEKINNIPLAETFIKILKEIQEKVDMGEGTTSISSHPCAKIAYEQVHQLLPMARDFVRNCIPDNKWYQTDAIEQIPELVNRLSNGIPPNEIIQEVDFNGVGIYKTTPAYLTSILIAGWIYEAYWQEKHEEESVMKYTDICRLLLKACEDSRLMRQKS